MPKTPGEMQDAIKAGLQRKTGKTFEEWVRIVQQSGPGTRKERVEWLKTHHQLGTVAAGLVVSQAEGKGTDYHQGEALIEAMFAGPKAGLHPIYEQLVKLATGLGTDVTVWPCRTQVTLKRRRQFAWIKPATNTRIDLGLALPDVKPTVRLLDIPGTDEKDRVRLRIPIARRGEIDDEVKRWLKTAYDLDA